MGVKLSAVRSKVGLAVVGGALLLAGAGVGTAAATGVIGTQPASDSGPVVSTPAATTVEPSPVATSDGSPVEQPELPAAVPPQPATVEDVSTPEATQVPVPVPADQDRSGVGSRGVDGNYTPAPPIQRPGEPPVAPPPPLPVPVQPEDPKYDQQG